MKQIMDKKGIVLIILSCFLFAGCKDEIQSIQSLTVVQNENEIVLKWEPSNVSGFKYYRIMRATDGQHYITINNVDSVGSDAFNKNITTYTDTSFPFVDSAYYKIMAFGDQIISSPNVCVHINKPITISESIGNAYIMPEENKILVYGSNGSNTYMYLYDYTTNKLIKKISLFVYSSGSVIFFGKYNGKYEFYFYDSWNNKLNIYDALTLTPIAYMSYWSGYPMFATNNRGTIYANNGYSNTDIIDRKKLTFTSYLNSYYINQLSYMNINNKLLGSNYRNIVLYTLDVNGNITSEILKSFDYSSNPIYIENSTLVYWGYYNSKKIINTDTWQENVLTLPTNAVKDFTTLYATKNVLYACTNNESKLYCFSMTDFKLIKTIDIRLIPNKLLSDSNYLFFYGYSNGLNIVDKIKLIQ